MSLWQRAQSALFMKKFDGTGPPTFVSPEEGKNGPPAPCPSPSIASGGRAGFAISCFGGRRSATARAAGVASASSAPAAAAARAPPTSAGSGRRREAASAASAAAETHAMCA